MVKNQTLYDIFTEYRNGNKDILNKLFDIKRQEDEMRSVVCTVPDVNRMVKCAYRCYSLNGMSLKGQYCKYFYNAFSGSEEDMMSIFAETLQDIFFDKLDKPVEITDNKSLYALLKTEVCKRVNAMLKIQDTEIGVEYQRNETKEFHKDKYDNYSIDRFDEYAVMKYMQGNGSLGHLDFFEHCQRILKSYDITEMLQMNNVVTKNIIQLFDMPETGTINKYGDADVICHREIVDLYNRIYNGNITDERVSESYNIIFDLLMKTYYGYVPISRKEYRQKDKAQKHTIINKYEYIATETKVHKATAEEVRNIQYFIQKETQKSEYVRLMEKKFKEMTAK